MSKQTIAVDFDGVIHRYSKGWHDGSIYDIEMEGAFNSMLALMERGYNVVVFTARPSEAVNAWLVEHWPFKMFPVPKAQNDKPIAIAYIDDRAVRFTNWNEMLEMFPYAKN